MPALTPQLTTIRTAQEWEVFETTIGTTPVRDIYRAQLRELFFSQHPHQAFLPPTEKEAIFSAYYHQQLNNNPEYYQGTWLCFPWFDAVFHILPENEYFQVRTMRNRNLITLDEQYQLHDTRIAVAGLSVGKSILLSLLRLGIGRYFSLADADTVELSNINRAHYDVLSLGESKVELVAQECYQLDPYLELRLFTEGLTETNLGDFVEGVQLIIDAFDTFPLKLKLRSLAKQRKIPVISGVDIDTGVLLMVERYDLATNGDDVERTVFLHDLSPDSLKNATTPQEKTQFFIDMIGENLHSEVMLQSVRAVGSSLTGYPQLVVASQLFSALATLAAKEIILGTATKSGRYYLDLANFLRTT